MHFYCMLIRARSEERHVIDFIFKFPQASLKYVMDLIPSHDVKAVALYSLSNPNIMEHWEKKKKIFGELNEHLR